MKPKELCNHPKFLAKTHALNLWAEDNGFVSRLADLDFLLNHPKPNNLNDFDTSTHRKIMKYYEKIKD